MTPAIDPALEPGLPPNHGGTVITVGTFDGVHRGHWEVLEALRKRAGEVGMPAVLVTFHPHPLQVVRPDDAPELLTTPLEKKEILAESALDYAVFIPFTETLRSYPPERFVREILIDRLRMKHLVIGYDHGFGRGRSGDVDTLRDIGDRLGFAVDVVEALRTNGDAISSTKIRTALREGRVEEAARGLGRPYSARGPVIRGDGRGRALGFPTANIHITDAGKLLPREGVYAVCATLRSGTYRGVLHLGPRPTFEGSPPSVELHLFDFDDDLYGEEVRVDFCARIRGIHRFGSRQELVEAIREDVDRAVELFEAGTACGDKRQDARGQDARGER
ncbi:MAG: bifunctional riboflavin kinase/FAD synthetase [Longimicrobiales bacterium]|nr:bifunctional riboflavin kinase/FAD synthetase [Longimicrobiales bacterium]